MLKSRWFQLITMLIVGLIVGWWGKSMYEDMRSSGVEMGVWDLIYRQQNAWNKAELPEFLRAYEMSDAITFYSDDVVEQGWESLNHRFTAKYGKGSKAMGRLEFTEMKFDVLNPEAVLVRGRWATSQNEKPDNGLFTILVRWTPHGWKVVHDHTSAKKPEK